jgi:hypothetical protein
VQLKRSRLAPQRLSAQRSPDQEAQNHRVGQSRRAPTLPPNDRGHHIVSRRRLPRDVEAAPVRQDRLEGDDVRPQVVQGRLESLCELAGGAFVERCFGEEGFGERLEPQNFVRRRRSQGTEFVPGRQVVTEPGVDQHGVQTGGADQPAVDLR